MYLIEQSLDSPCANRTVALRPRGAEQEIREAVHACAVEADPAEEGHGAAVLRIDALHGLHHRLTTHGEDPLDAYRVHPAFHGGHAITSEHIGQLDTADRIVVGDQVDTDPGESQHECDDDAGAVLAGVTVHKDGRGWGVGERSH